ncbi:MAG: DUF1178 family protein [Candidatus Tokpelaia sp.]|nr:MAG: DUF1178 family protein [Candidatus Tokpelaia sp.]KAA6206221.1 MAG: DUF1178 family protein [Candidatus Tokpelaia sp.]
MIRFSLYCKREHKFEGWFGSNEDYEKQKNAGLILCPACGSAVIGKGLMAPHISAAHNRDSLRPGAGREVEESNSAPALAERTEVLQQLLVLQKMHRRKLEVLHKLQTLARKMRENAENVGEKFAEEARKIHFGEAEKRSIYGRAGAEDIHALQEEGIDVMHLPPLPEDNN